jgi:hypothetical protein
MSHRAASLALAQCEEWGLIERADSARRSGQRGPAAVAWTVVDDHWEWFRRVASARKERETDPVLPVIVRYTEQARAAVEHDADPELARLGERLAALLDFVERFDRGGEIFVRGDARAIEGLFATLDRLEPETVDRLWRRVGDLGPDDLVRALEALAKLPPSGRAPASARSLLPRAVVLEDRCAGGDRGRGAAAQRRRKGPWNGDRLAMALDQLAGARDPQLVEEEAELGAQVVRDLTRGVRGQSPELALERADRLLARPVQELVLGLALLALLGAVVPAPLHPDRRPRHVGAGSSRVRIGKELPQRRCGRRGEKRHGPSGSARFITWHLPERVDVTWVAGRRAVCRAWRRSSPAPPHPAARRHRRDGSRHRGLAHLAEQASCSPSPGAMRSNSVASGDSKRNVCGTPGGASPNDPRLA